MKRRIYWTFIGFLTVLLLALSWWAFYPAIPNTPTAKRGFHMMTGLDPSEVSGIHYYYNGEGISGGDDEFLRFTYPDDVWLQRFLHGLSLERRTGSNRSLFISGMPDWWDYSTIWSLSECYGRGSEHPPNDVILWIDRQHQYIYLYFANPQRLTTRSSKQRLAVGSFLVVEICLGSLCR